MILPLKNPTPNPRLSRAHVNLLIRAVLGVRVHTLLERYEESCEFYSPDVCFLEARRYLSQILGNRGLGAGPALGVLDETTHLVQPIEQALYQSFEAVARTRMAPRDLRDWSVVALALALNLPIWTEDQDFFGSGIATWTTDRAEIYLREG